METLVLERGNGVYLTGVAHLARSQDDISSDLAAATGSDWTMDKANPFIGWITGDFVESDKPNQNKQYWTAGDLEMAEYSIKYAPLNMVHKFRTPVGFYAATRTVALDRAKTENASWAEQSAKSDKPLKIQALSGMWTHIFPFEAAQVEEADAQGLLFYSMECRGSHLKCAGDQGCGETFDYMNVAGHCEHLKDRASVRHIVNPVFRGGALIVPPVNPGWKDANAHVLTDAVRVEAAAFAEETEEQYTSLVADGASLTASAWEHIMSLVVASSR